MAGRVENLTPFKKGYDPRREGNGKPKGSKHISTWIRQLLEDENFIVDNLDGKQYKGAPLKAIILTAVSQSLNGDQRWAEWLAKYGYGGAIEVNNLTQVNFITYVPRPNTGLPAERTTNQIPPVAGV